MSTLRVNTITPQSGSTNQLSGSLLITNALTVNGASAFVNATFTQLLTGTTFSGSAANFSGNVTAATLTGTLQTAAQTNVTSVGTLTSLTVSGAITGATSTNTINGLVINSGGLGGATGIKFGIGAAFSSGQAEAYTTSTTPMGIGTVGAQPLRFYTNSALVAAFDSSGNLAVDTNTLYVDAANNTVGIGTATPGTTYQLTVRRDGADTGVRIGNNTTYDQFIYFNGNNDWSMGMDYSNSNAFVISNSSTLGTNDRVVLTTSGNLGLGVTPNSGWTRPAMQGGAAGTVFYYAATNVGVMSANYFYNGADKYIGNGHATQYTQSSGAHSWFIAPNNTSGAGATISTFTQAMTLDASGNLGVGTSPIYRLDVRTASGPYVAQFRNTSTSTSEYSVVLFNQAASGSAAGYVGTGGSAVGGAFANNFVVGTQSSNSLVFATNDFERARITSGGEFLIGTTTATGPKLEVSGTARATGGINTNSGSASVANTTWTTLFTVPQTTAGKGIYSFMANYLDASDGQAFVELLVDRTYVRIASQSDGATLKLRLSGQNVQAYHNYGATVTISWGFLQIQIP